jgi:hypothetical protein
MIALVFVGYFDLLRAIRCIKDLDLAGPRCRGIDGLTSQFRQHAFVQDGGFLKACRAKVQRDRNG